MKDCSYCERTLFPNHQYACQCNPDIFVCRDCSQIPCYECQQRPRNIQEERCSECYQLKPTTHLMWKQRYSRYCKECCFQALKAMKPQTVRSQKIPGFSRHQIENFLKAFCYRCHKTLRKLDKDSIKEPISLLEKNLCQTCQNPKDLQNIPISIPSNQENNKKPEPQQQKPRQTSKKTRLQLFQKWRKQQKIVSRFINCMSCDAFIRQTDSTAHLSEDMVACGLCYCRTQNMQNEINKSKIRIMGRQPGKQENLMIQKKRSVQRPESDYSVLQRTNQIIEKIEKNTKEVEKKQEKPQQKLQQKQEQKPQERKPKVIQKQQQKHVPQRDREPQPQKPSQKQQEKNEPKHQQQELSPKHPLLKKTDSHSKFQNLVIELQWTNDTQIIECSKCGLSIEALYSIWQQEENVPLCKCCFSDLLENLRENSIKRRQRYRLREEEEEAEKAKLPKTEKKEQNFMIGEQIAPKTEPKPNFNQIGQEPQRESEKKRRIPAEKDIKTQLGMTQFEKRRTTQIKRNVTTQKDKRAQIEKLRDQQAKKQKQRQEEQQKKFTSPRDELPLAKRLQMMQRQRAQPLSNQLFRGTHYASNHDKTNVMHLGQERRQFLNCHRCGQIRYISSKYQIEGKPVCMQCISAINLAIKRKNNIPPR